MSNFQGSESQGIGGTGHDRFRGRRQWRQSNVGKSSDAFAEDDPTQLVALPRKSHTDHRQGNYGRFRRSAQLARNRARRRATGAAIAAYQDTVRGDDPKQLASRAALRAYLEICPNEVDVSDQVAKAIILATANLTSKP